MHAAIFAASAGCPCYWVWASSFCVLKLVLAYAALGCVWIVLAYATFTSVGMGSGPRGCCGGPTTSYSTSYSTEGISSFFLES